MNGKITGTVKMFDEARGFGFIRGQDNGDYFVHFSDIKMDGYRTLRQGETVSFDIERQPDGRTKAINVTLIPAGKENAHEIPNIETYAYGIVPNSLGHGYRRTENS